MIQNQTFYFFVSNKEYLTIPFPIKGKGILVIRLFLHGKLEIKLWHTLLINLSEDLFELLQCGASLFQWLSCTLIKGERRAIAYPPSLGRESPADGTLSSLGLSGSSHALLSARPGLERVPGDH